MKYYICKSDTISEEILEECSCVGVARYSYSADAMEWYFARMPYMYYLLYNIPDSMLVYVSLLSDKSYNDRSTFSQAIRALLNKDEIL